MLKRMMIVAIALSCGCKDAPKPAPKTTTTPSPKVEKAPKPAKLPSLSATKKRALPKDTPKETLKKYSAFLRAGQKAVREKKYDDGITAYQSALKLDPMSPTALGEMGWAYFLKKELDPAEKFTQKALTFSTNKNQLGMFLYNMGRIAQEKGNERKAAQFYQQSVDRRPNKVVQKRLDALIVKGIEIGTDPQACAFKLQTKHKTLDAICKSISGSTEPCTADHKTATGPWVKVTDKIKIAFVAASDSIVTDHLAVINMNGKLHVAKLGMSSTGMEASEQWSVRKISLQQVVPDGPQEIVIESNYEMAERGERNTDEDGPMWDWSTEESSRLDVINVSGDAPQFLLSMKTDNVKWSFLPAEQKIKVVAEEKGSFIKSGTYKYGDVSSCPLPY